MKTLAHPSFFQTFDLLLGAGNPGLKLSSWTRDGVSWERERHSFAGPRHGLSVEIVTVTRPGRNAWSMMVVKEYWWAGKESKPIRSLHWAKVITGRRSDPLNWFRIQETLLRDKMVTARLTDSPPHRG